MMLLTGSLLECWRLGIGSYLGYFFGKSDGVAILRATLLSRSDKSLDFHDELMGGIGIMDFEKTDWTLNNPIIAPLIGERYMFTEVRV